MSCPILNIVLLDHKPAPWSCVEDNRAVNSSIVEEIKSDVCPSKISWLALKKKTENLRNTWFPLLIWFTVSIMVFLEWNSLEDSPLTHSSMCTGPEELCTCPKKSFEEYFIF